MLVCQYPGHRSIASSSKSSHALGLRVHRSSTFTTRNSALATSVRRMRCTLLWPHGRGASGPLCTGASLRRAASPMRTQTTSQ